MVATILKVLRKTSLAEWWSPRSISLVAKISWVMETAGLDNDTMILRVPFLHWDWGLTPYVILYLVQANGTYQNNGFFFFSMVSSLRIISQQPPNPVERVDKKEFVKPKCEIV